MAKPDKTDKTATINDADRMFPLYTGPTDDEVNTFLRTTEKAWTDGGRSADTVRRPIRSAWDATVRGLFGVLAWEGWIPEKDRAVPSIDEQSTRDANGTIVKRCDADALLTSVKGIVRARAATDADGSKLAKLDTMIRKLDTLRAAFVIAPAEPPKNPGKREKVADETDFFA